MLKMCPNLEKIEDLSICHINAVVVAQKGPALKSLIKFNYCDLEGEETVVTAYEKLAGLEPKLTSLEISSEDFDIDNIFELVKYFFSVLQNSHENLESLQIAPLGSDEVQNLPALKGLKELELLPSDHGDEVFFIPEMSVKEILPNVRKFGSSHHTWDEVFINRHLPENVISPWGTQIIELSVNHLTASALPLLQRRFPSIQKLEIQNSRVDLPKILLELSRCWPQLKLLTISWYGCYESGMIGTEEDRGMQLVHAFTGLPFKVIKLLVEDPFICNLIDKKIQAFEESIIAKLKELRVLRIFLPRYFNEWDSRTRLFHVANEFGFSLHPELAVTLVVNAGRQIAEEMKSTFMYHGCD